MKSKTSPNKQYNCHNCHNQYLKDNDGYSSGCKCFDDGIACDFIPVSDFEFVPKNECYTCRYQYIIGEGNADVKCRKYDEGLDCEYIEDDDYIRR